MNFNKYGRTAQLFDYQTMSGGLVGGILNSDGTITTNAASSSWVITKYIPVAGREFTLQRQASGGATSICLYDSNQTYITGLAYNGNGTVTVSANTDVSYIRFTYYRTENTGNIMLNEGSTAKPFEPYGNTWTDVPHYIHNTSTDTITTLPADLYANDTTATVGLKGNMEQTGTPTPQNPIMPQGTGERTGNLAYGRIDDVNIDATGTIGRLSGFDIAIGRVESGVTYTANTYVFAFFTNEPTTGSVSYDGSRIVTTQGEPSTFTAPITGYVAFRLDPGEPAMLNTGSTALPYEPYGYKIPILSANTTTPVYLGEVQSTRRIKKFVLTGEENITSGHIDVGLFNIPVTDYLKIADVVTNICSHYIAGINVNGWSDVTDMTSRFYSNAGSPSKLLYIRDSSYTTVADFKSYLQQQYANGTPVTIWYVLATPTTGIVNEPLRKIGTYADTVSGITIPTIAGANTLSVGTTLQPSEITVNYKGWHPVADVHEYDNNYTIATMQALTIAQLQTHTISELQGGEWS